MIGYVGVPGTGKTTAAVAHLLRLSRSTPCYALAHDPNRNLPPTLPDGTPTGIIRHDGCGGRCGECARATGLPCTTVVTSLRRRLMYQPDGIHVLDMDPTSIVTVARGLAAQGLRKVEGGEEYGTPVAVYIDEAVVWREAKRSGELGPNLRDLLARRRHHHVALLYTTQLPRLNHKLLYALTGELYLFRVDDPDDARQLAGGGVPRAITDRLANLPDYKHIHFKRGAKPPP